ncbi:uncharacterized protein BJ171DRAFT_272756 [Polychytrium aggregatum]|uniref:uncharacterized protein n=1 Tax=Polychytrium aggregatum TaxID=110093 RepID=UPI0022FDE979|nr:uncharacterized protein BJ171DRAFT_272756 [Polychytrium aggregatum]KAI9193325.1 hypothetical protein BJ171DRAFT_272756 [Polychytrium aggregatum]
MAASTNDLSSSLDASQPALLYPDIFTIVCFNDSFQLALDHSTIKTLLRVSRRARSLLSSKLARFHRWCQKEGLCHPDGQMRIGLTPSDQIALSLHCKEKDPNDRSWLVVQAEQGSAPASYFLARVLQIDVDRGGMRWIEWNAKLQEIFHHLETASSASHPMAQFHLAECYLNRIGVDQDQIRAVEMYRSLADCGMPQAQIALGRCYESGEGVDQDYNTAIEQYTKAADQGCDNGRLRIVFLRGWFSFTGHGVEQSDEDALAHWQQVSTQSTDPVIKSIATHMVGWMHYLGRGTQQDQQKGIKMIRDSKSSAFKFGEAECLYGWPLAPSNSPASREFFKLCQLGLDHNWLCKHLTAVCLVHGFGTAQDKTKAADIFEQLAHDEHSESQAWFGGCYGNGLGVPEDESKAFEWYSKSANQGNSYGQLGVGWSYYDESGVPRDFAEAVKWFRKSAEQNNRDGQYALGICFENGEGVTEDIDVAVFWYRKAAEHDQRRAINRLKSIGRWP